MATLLAVFAEFERKVLRERVRADLAHARQNRKRLGRTSTSVRRILETKEPSNDDEVEHELYSERLGTSRKAGLARCANHCRCIVFSSVADHRLAVEPPPGRRNGTATQASPHPPHRAHCPPPHSTHRDHAPL